MSNGNSGRSSGARQPYERFQAWAACHELALGVYRVTQRWPKAELYGLTSQARRAATSAAINIAEGSAKRGPRELRRFLDIALGSLAELSYILRLSRDLEFTPKESFGELEALRDHASRVTWGLYSAVSRSERTARAKSGLVNS
jgi:four helix bundle protein